VPLSLQVNLSNSGTVGPMRSMANYRDWDNHVKHCLIRELVQLHLVETGCAKQAKSEPDRGSDRREIQSEITPNIQKLFGKADCLAGRYSYPVLTLL
jgi:hypothetical protein